MMMKIKTYKCWKGVLSLTSVDKHYKLSIKHTSGAGPHLFPLFYRNRSDFSACFNSETQERRLETFCCEQNASTSLNVH